MSTTSNFLRALFASKPVQSVILVAAYLASFGNEEVKATDVEIAANTDLSTKSVQRAKKWLVEHNFAKVTGNARKHNGQKWTLQVDITGGHYRWTSQETENAETACNNEELKVDIIGGHSRAGAFYPSNNINNNLVVDNKQGCSNSRRRVREKVGDLGLEIEEPKKKRTKFTPPTLEEVRAYFGTRKAIIANWFDEAKNFFDYWDGIDWQQKPGVHITKWKTRADKWIERTVNEQKPINQSQDGDIYDISSDPARRAQAYAEGLAELLARDREIEATGLAY